MVQAAGPTTERAVARPSEQMTAHAAEQTTIKHATAEQATAQAQPESRTDPRQDLAQEIRPDPQQRLRELLEAGAGVRRALARLEEERRRLMREISGIEAASRQLQEQLPPELRRAAHDQYLAAELRRIDQELPIAVQGAAQGAAPGSPPVPAGTAASASVPGASVPGAPGGIERRATPRPAPIRLPELTMQFPEECAPEPVSRGGLLGRARRALLRTGRDARQGA
jgi:hypothetical protein